MGMTRPQQPVQLIGGRPVDQGRAPLLQLKQVASHYTTNQVTQLNGSLVVGPPITFLLDHGRRVKVYNGGRRVVSVISLCSFLGQKGMQQGILNYILHEAMQSIAHLFA